MIKRPMKGEAIDEDHFERLIYPLHASPKIDGFRCVLGSHPMTSRLAKFPNRHFHETLSNLLPPRCFLDAEAVVGRRRGPGVLQRTSSGLTSEDGEPDFTLWVFDRPGLDGHWYDRYLAAHDLIGSVAHERIKLLKHRLIRDHLELRDYLTEKLELGYEGIMIRDTHGPYKEGKSTVKQGWLLKCKPFKDSEGRIKGWFEEMENTNEAKREATGKLKRSSAKSGKKAKGTLGGFILHDIKDGTEVRVGGGFTKQQRQKLWELIQRDPKALLGKLVRYKSQAVGAKEKPRHPNFKEFVDFRPEWDL